MDLSRARRGREPVGAPAGRPRGGPGCSVWRCCCRGRPRRSWRCWRCSRPGRPICRSTRRCRRRGSGSCSPMPRRSPRSPPPGWPARLDGCDLLVIDVDDPAVDTQPGTALAGAGARRTSPTSSTPRAPPGSPKGVADHPPQRHPAVRRHWMPAWPAAGQVWTQCHSYGLRLLGVGDLRCAAARRAAGGGARVGGRLTGGLPRLAGRGTGQRVKPDPVGGGGAVARRGWSRWRWWWAVRPARPRWWIGGRPGG